jgi:hypothetical protein
MNKPDGGPAFPCENDPLAFAQSGGTMRTPQGMTLRDYFAAAALPVCLDLQLAATRATGDTTNAARKTAMAAYNLADAMLAERTK